MKTNFSKELMNFFATAAVPASSAPAPAPGVGAVLQKRKPVGVNDLCPCGSGKKYKKCCRGRIETHHAITSGAKRPPPKAKVAPLQYWADEPENLTAAAMLRAGEPESCVYAFIQTGMFIPENSRPIHTKETLAIWDAARAEFVAAAPGIQRDMIAKAKRPIGKETE